MADASIRFGAEFPESEAKSFEDLVDRIASKFETAHTLDVDTAGAESKLSKMADMVTTALSFEGIGKAGEFFTGIAERGEELRTTMLGITAQTGLFGAELDALRDRGQAAFQKGVGESVAEATKGLATAQQQLGQFLDPAELDAFVVKAGGIAKVFDKDLNEVIGKSRTFISNWGLSGDEAGNLMALAMQKAGNAMDDVLDTTDEYSQLMKEAGFSAEEFVGTLTTGIQAGVRDTDKLADAIKETQIRLRAGDTSNALKDLTGPIADQIKEIVKLGEQGSLSVREVLQRTSKLTDEAFDAGQISDALRNKLNVAVTGTPAEDIGAELYGRIFSADIDEAAVTAQATAAGEQAAAAIEPSLFGSISRFVSGLTEKAAAVAGPAAEAIGGALTTVSQVGPGITMLSEKLGGENGLLGMVTKLSGGGGFAGLASKVGMFATGPVGIAVAAVGLLVTAFTLLYTNSESFRKAIDSAVSSVKEFIAEVWERAQPVLETFWELIKEVGSFIGDVVVAYFTLWWDAVSGVFSAVGDLIGGLIGAKKEGSALTGILDLLGKGFTFVRGLVDSMRVSLAGIAGAFNAAVEVIGNVVNLLGRMKISDAIDAMTGLGGKVGAAFSESANAKIREINTSAAFAGAGASVDDEPAKEAGGKIGGAVVAGATAAVKASTVSWGGEMARLLGDEFERALQEQLRHAIALDNTGRQAIEQQFSNEIARIDASLAAKIEDERKKIYDASGKRLATVTAESEKNFVDITARWTEERNRKVAQLNTDREAALRDHVARLEQIEARSLADRIAREVAGSEVRPLPVPAESLSRLEDTALESLNVATTTALLAQEGLYRSFFDSVTEERAEQVQEELAALSKEESAIRLSLARREGNAQTHAERLIEIARERAAKEQEIANDQFDLLRSINRGIAESFRRTGEQYATLVDEQLRKAKEGKGDLIDTLTVAAAQMTAITLQAGVEQQNMADVAARASIDAALKILLANEAKFLFEMFGTSISELGPILGPLAFVGVAATLGTLAGLATNALNQAKSREHGGWIEGGPNLYMVNDDPLGRPEWLVDHVSATRNRDYLEWMKANQGRDLSEHPALAGSLVGGDGFDFASFGQFIREVEASANYRAAQTDRKSAVALEQSRVALERSEETNKMLASKLNTLIAYTGRTNDQLAAGVGANVEIRERHGAIYGVSLRAQRLAKAGRK